jgi:GNAT superfamily N-acetyltransferase
MKILKLLMLVFLHSTILPGAQPSQINGALNAVDKEGTQVTLNWIKVESYETFLDLAKHIFPLAAEAFADETRNFLLDDKLQIRQEYRSAVEKLCEEKQEKEKFEAHLAIARYDDRKQRVAAKLRSFEQRYESLWATKWSITKPLVVTVFNAITKELLGWTTFHCIDQNCVQLDQLAIAPEFQNRGLAKLLIFSILKIVPETTCIYVNTALWNLRAHASYEKLGFKMIEVASKNPTIVMFKYKVKD